MLDENNPNVIRIDNENAETKSMSFKDKILDTFKNLPLKLKEFRSKARDSKKIKIIFVSIFGLVFFSLMISFVFSVTSEKEPVSTRPVIMPKSPEISTIQTINLTKLPVQKHTELDNMITKANILYSQGSRLEALNLFEHIALFSQSIASYNLGVIKLKEKDYQKAITLFDASINTGEDISISALNAAYSAYMMGDMSLYEYYQGIAFSHLLDTTKLPIYSYLYGLLQYYRGSYFEALSPFVNPSSKDYQAQSSKMAAQLFLVFNDDFNALKYLRESATKEDNFTLGLLYARLGEYDKAKTHIREFLRLNPNHTQALMALQIISLKLGEYKEASKILDSVAIKQKNIKALEIYPIKVRLKDELFDVSLAQTRFWESKFQDNRMLAYKLFFYYAPFKIFDATDALRVIQEGQINARFNNLEVAKDTLIEGQKISNINENIAKGLKEMLTYNVRGALKYMIQSLEIYPNHWALHYNIGLLYAQNGDFDNAYTHFVRAYHLNTNDVISGIFAVMSGRITYRNVDRILRQISNDFEEIKFESKEHREFILSLLQYANGQSFNPNMAERANNATTHKSLINQPMYFALNAAYGIASENKEAIILAFDNLKKMYPNDLVANIMYKLALYYKQDIKDVALQINAEINNENLNMDSVYYGASVARELYVYVAFITGNLKNIQNELESKLINEIHSPGGVMQALALSYIYSNDFERAFVIYNSLIDDIKEGDYHTKFLGAIAAIGAGHSENAALLLQLSKLGSSTNYEGRYALGLLYQEAKNIRPAISHYDSIRSDQFKSSYFDFEIDTHLLLQAQNQ